MGSPAVILVLASVLSRVRISTVLVDKVKSTHRICSCSARFNHNASILRHLELLHLSRVDGDSPRGPLKQRGDPRLKPATRPKHAKPNHAGA
jgi:hypothetical protein